MRLSGLLCIIVMILILFVGSSRKLGAKNGGGAVRSSCLTLAPAEEARQRRREQREDITDGMISLAQMIKKPFRDANFWGRAIRIYTSYKVLQLKSSLARPLQGQEMDMGELAKTTERLYDIAHEVNSKRMIDLCLQLRGFYLKTGQFLGTRHDFMPRLYTQRLSQLHDDVPPMDEKSVRRIVERELRGPVDKFFTDLDLVTPIGAASIAQVHVGTWRATGEKVAVKVQYPNAERIMTGDLKNLRALAEFLQRTEFKFDLLSSIKELQKQIVNEFNFPQEAKNMDFMYNALAVRVPDVNIPKSIIATKRMLVMTFVEGENLCRLAEFKEVASTHSMPEWVKHRAGRRILNTLARTWAEMIFELRFFNADPHPGNICLGRRMGVLDWGQMKRVTDDAAAKFSHMIIAIASGEQEQVVKAFANLGIKMTDPDDKRGVEFMALSMLDTRQIPGFTMDPFGPDSPISGNTICEMPSDLYAMPHSVQSQPFHAALFGH